MNIDVDLQNDSAFINIPPTTLIQQWLNTAVNYLSINVNKKFLTIRLVDKNESSQLNKIYRHQQGATNVLSFLAEDIPGFDSDSFGDLAICIPLVIEEAQAQHKSFEAHLVHLVIHGFLHLLGYDHEARKQADIMENLEIEILHQLGISNPYGTC